MSPFMSIAITQDTFVRFELIVNGRVGRLRNHECNLVQGVRLFGRESSRHLRGRRDILLTLHRRDETHSLKHSFKKVSISHAQLAHFSTLAKEKHMLLILNFSTLTFITNARTTMPFARLHSQMVCTQSEPAEIPQHMFVQILVQVGGDRKWRTSRTTLRTPTPLVIRDCFLVYCART